VPVAGQCMGTHVTHCNEHRYTSVVWCIKWSTAVMHWGWRCSGGAAVYQCILQCALLSWIP
jgi:hypothetical protein